MTSAAEGGGGFGNTDIGGRGLISKNTRILVNIALSFQINFITDMNM